MNSAVAVGSSLLSTVDVLAAMSRSCRRVFAVLGSIALFTLPGCARQDEMTALAAQVTALETKVLLLESKQYLSELERTDVAYLTPGSEGYSVIESALGRFTVSLSNIEEYANGSRITLTFGNLTAASINSPKVTVEWGTADAKGSPNNDSQRSRQIEFAQPFRPGSWNAMPVILEGIPPSELGFVRVKSLTNGAIFLRS